MKATTLLSTLALVVIQALRSKGDVADARSPEPAFLWDDQCDSLALVDAAPTGDKKNRATVLETHCLDSADQWVYSHLDLQRCIAYNDEKGLNYAEDGNYIYNCWPCAVWNEDPPTLRCQCVNSMDMPAAEKIEFRHLYNADGGPGAVRLEDGTLVCGYYNGTKTADKPEEDVQ